MRRGANAKVVVWSLIAFTWVMQTGVDYSVQAQPGGSREEHSVRLELQNATIEQALSRLAEELEGGFICADPKGVTLERLELEKPPAQAFWEVCAHFGYEGGRWRRLFLVRPRTEVGTLEERILRHLPRKVRVRRSLGDERITLDVLVDLAVNFLRSPEGSEEREAWASKLCQAITWPKLVEVVRKFDRLCRGEAILGVKSPPRPPRFEFHKRLLLIWPLQQGDPGWFAPREILWVGYDQFREYLRAHQRGDPLEVFVQRALEVAHAREQVYADDPLLDHPVTLSVQREPVPAILQKLAARSGLGLHGQGSAREKLVSLEVRECPVRDLLTALAFLSGTVLVRQERGKYALEAPNLLAEYLAIALPVQVWAYAQLTSVEQQLEWQQLCQAFWDCLTPAQQKRLETGFLKVSDLGEEQRFLLLSTLSVGVGKTMGKILRNLPRRGLPPPLEVEQVRFTEDQEVHAPLLRFRTPDYFLEFGFGLYQEVQARAAAPEG
ncbi:MAG TPA: hypothetical protein EYP85_04425 [Armatimonadetes bacterium]|nr:hypothetical protein [Armatimonadota bacterium]